MLVTTNRCLDQLKLLELYFATVPDIPPGLFTLFAIRSNLTGGDNVFRGVQSLLQRSHKATTSEQQQAEKGHLLKLLHDPNKTAA